MGLWRRRPSRVAGRRGSARGSAGWSPPAGAARPAARVRRLLDLRVRRAQPRGVRRGAGLRGRLDLGGSAWWHTSSVGHFVNSMHLWSVELFFVTMVIHLWGKFWMAAWRGKRAPDLGHRRHRLRRLDRHGVHRLPVADGLRLPVDRRRGQGRHQLGRASAPGSTSSNPGQMLLWHVVAAALRARRDRRVAHRPGAPPWRRSADWTRSRGGEGT